MPEDHAFADCLADAVADEEYFGIDGPCPILKEAGNPRLVLISGENAGGKSFFAKVLSATVRSHEKKIEWMPVSMSMRTQTGMHRVFMFGDEGRDSTGKISLHAVLGGLQTCRGRDNPHVLLLDEPDVGLSEGYQAALGDLLAEFASSMPEKTEALVVVTHSRALAAKLMPLGPICIRVGDDRRKTKDWIAEGDLHRTADDIRNLAKKGVERLRRIQRVIDQRTEERRAEAGAKSGPHR